MNSDNPCAFCIFSDCVDAEGCEQFTASHDAEMPSDEVELWLPFTTA
jgi:hypothetical protein